MVPWMDFLYWTAFARIAHCVLFWHIHDDGDFIPFMLHVDDDVWSLISTDP